MTTDFKTLSKTALPAYTWLWNTTVTREGIAARLDDMKTAGIPCFYVIAEPENEYMMHRRTHLSPDYLSEEYLDLLHFAYEYAKGLGIDMWLYNEGGFPSGMVCGKIRELRPDLAPKHIFVRRITSEGGAYHPDANVVAAYAADRRIQNGDTVETGTEIAEYVCFEEGGRRSDNASIENTDLFLKLTHEKLAARFGDAIGGDLTLMFDDEAYMGTWTVGLEKLFLEKYGYDLCPYLPFITGTPIETDDQYRAVIDYRMLCGDLVRDNYFIPMREWLNARGMLSTGHLDRDNFADGCVDRRYGNTLATMRAFDVPGIDMIWNQIDFPKNNGYPCWEGYAFYPLIASSAAAQQGTNMAMSESFAVCGAQITPEAMRYGVNFQAVRGITLFNFMVMSYDTDTVMPLQYRPNYIAQNPGMDCLTQINTYTARLCTLLQKGKADVTTALYYPLRTINAGGPRGAAAVEAYIRLGDCLEAEGGSFDLIDEDFVLEATRENGGLTGKHVRYDHIFIPEETYFEREEVLTKLEGLNREMVPALIRSNPFLRARKVLLEDGGELCFICNLSDETVSETVKLTSDKIPYAVDLESGEVYFTAYSRSEAHELEIPLTLLRGEGMMLYLTDGLVPAKHRETCGEKLCELTATEACIRREYVLEDHAVGAENRYFARGERPIPMGDWPESFSGEAEYRFILPELPVQDVILDLGEVRHFAKICVNGEKTAEVTMPPYTARISGAHAGDEIRITVANTIANACAHTAYFNIQDIRDVGPYHARMVLWERETAPGGFSGKIRLYEVKRGHE